MKINEKELGCENCKFLTGYVCNICWKKVYEEFNGRKGKANGKNSKRDSKKSQDY